MAGDVRVVLTTVPDRETGERVGGALVRERLAACCNLLEGVHSTYWWQGDVESAREALLVFKTSRDRVEALRERVVDLHPYEVPELLVLDVEDGHGPYLDWVLRETRPVGEAGR